MLTFLHYSALPWESQQRRSAHGTIQGDGRVTKRAIEANSRLMLCCI
ncbi:MAG: hypothetical protein JGK24_18465 [Microcoleus sp. PH2017_29_MFU_D_A]|nr:MULTISPECIES: hypothetical protein [unclassified Microcoleus]MCC3419148.1 hypothetical protein [Microcoleus sp. PH2017_07_MST_O_A]MCC3429983.1 hypothetical protein [Microcoleus sp. PH2017_04_SCI_O_A]MCC3441970.1 hypothetical protein [Microcoleus sp. PH2017_03_ELD_O_A]MCC3464699.1 hypothetical protein [Microcoleus sp. PH2017_06_SFM_O_A]MCC3503204.1 hypothetical protein [Microcoleus sp. PH2017_19_SFW_U_A]MCC3511807.1 hypothetical protein [Microcoleus sp. PH2017_17_BER_D_A]